MNFSETVFGIGLAPGDDAISGCPGAPAPEAAARGKSMPEKAYKTKKNGKPRKASVSRISKKGSRTDITLCIGQDVYTVPTTGFERLADIVQIACTGYAFPSHYTRFLVPMADNLIEDHVKEIWKLGTKFFVDGKEYAPVVHNADLVRLVASNDRVYRFLVQRDDIHESTYAERYRVVNNHLLSLGRKSKGKEYKMITQCKTPRGLAFFAASASPAGDLSKVPSLTPPYSVSPVLDSGVVASDVQASSIEASSVQASSIEASDVQSIEASGVQASSSEASGVQSSEASGVQISSEASGVQASSEASGVQSIEASGVQSSEASGVQASSSEASDGQASGIGKLDLLSIIAAFSDEQ